MEKTIFQVEGMSCQHCVNAVTKAVEALPGVRNVRVDLAAKTAAAGHDSAKTTAEAIKAAIDSLGFEVTGYGAPNEK